MALNLSRVVVQSSIVQKFPHSFPIIIIQFKNYFIAFCLMQQDCKVIYVEKGFQKVATLNKCLREVLGEYVDLCWQKQKGILRLKKSTLNQFSYVNNETEQIFTHVPYFHGQKCPFLNQQLTSIDPNKTLKPCSCVMLHDKKTNRILITKRHEKLSFGGAWVLPGGHLEAKEGIIEGGLRECQEQVGLKPNLANFSIDQSIMVWESVAIDEQTSKIRSSAVVIFFSAECQQFQPKPQEKEVTACMWKNIEDNSDQFPYSKATKNGYAEGHLKFLSLIRQKIRPIKDDCLQ